MKCDICEHEGEDVVAGRWIFYCPKHKEIDRQKTIDNELSSGDGFMGNESDVAYALSDGGLCEMMEELI